MRVAVGRRSLGLAGLILLACSGCYLNTAPDQHRPTPSSSPDQVAIPPASGSFSDPFTGSFTNSGARQLVSRLKEQAALLGTSHLPALPEEEDGPPVTPSLPSLPPISHVSSYIFISDEAERTIERFVIAPSPQTPSVPALFTEADSTGHGLGLDMGLTELDMPALAAADWRVAVQAYCVCPDEAGLYHTPDGQARLDFATGRFRLSAGFTDAARPLRSVGLDLSLDRTRLLESRSHRAATELGFTNRDPVRLDGELELYLSGRNARHIGGQFSSAAPMSLSDILFVMQFASGP